MNLSGKKRKLRMPALFLVLIVIGIPPWLFILYPTEEAINLLMSPGSWIFCAVIWIIMSAAYLIGESN